MATNDTDRPAAAVPLINGTLPSPPFIHVPGLANLRDLGGYTITQQPGEPSRAVIRRGVLFRSADLSQLGDEGVPALEELGITHVFDLRSVKELARNGDSTAWEKATRLPAGWKAERVFVPIFLDQDYSPEAIARRFTHYSDGTEGFIQAYKSILHAAASPENPHAPFRTILEHLAAPTAPPSPILVHCTAGKDRTGIICALVLALCGVEDDIIAHEYSLTELGLAERKGKIIERLITTEPALLGNRERAEMMVSARRESMLGTLSVIREKYGSVEQYLVDHCRVPQEAVERLRRNLIVDIDVAAGVVPVDWKSHSELVPRL